MGIEEMSFSPVCDLLITWLALKKMFSLVCDLLIEGLALKKCLFLLFVIFHRMIGIEEMSFSPVCDRLIE